MDGGRTWRATGSTATAVYALSIDPVTPSTLYAAGQECDLSGCYRYLVFKSTDAGATWDAFDRGLSSAYVTTLAVDPFMPSRLYAGGNGGVFSIQQADACIGDCDASGDVRINDLVTLVNIGLGAVQPSACAPGVPSGATVDIALIIQAVNQALNGCRG